MTAGCMENTCIQPHLDFLQVSIIFKLILDYITLSIGLAILREPSRSTFVSFSIGFKWWVQNIQFAVYSFCA